ncbi:hypothetical protein [Pseudoxanthomonas sp. Soil82]|uniref:hypothetical protein n=1 Tax=Pseudoxanthomonas sp. Soil82 TaxID=3157341 RepID=UPI00338D925A
MDPLSTTTAFATIISLLADFVAHRGAADGKSFDEFMAWLSEQRHDEIKALLEQSTSTTISIKALLGESQREILDRLQSLDRSMASFAAGFDVYRDLAHAVHPASALSAQAISLLQQFHDSGASKILAIQSLDGTKSLPIVDGPSDDELKITEPRFLDDDLSTLVELGLLGLDHNGKGERLYSLRRSAVRLVENLRGA